MNIQTHSFSTVASIFFQESILLSLTPLQEKIGRIVLIAFALLAIAFLGDRCARFAPNDLFKDCLNPQWINTHPEVSLYDLGLTSYNDVINFVSLHGSAMTSLNLKDHSVIDDDQFAQLILLCPNLTHLLLNSCKITDKALEYLQGSQLKKVDFSYCSISDQGVKHLSGLQLTDVVFERCLGIHDQALEYLKGMPLKSVDFAFCIKLTDGALAHLEGMQLSRVDFRWCPQLTDKALDYLTGMPLEAFQFAGTQVTSRASTHSNL